MNLNHYFDPIEVAVSKKDYIDPKSQLVSSIKIHTRNNKITSIEGHDIVIIGVIDNKAEQKDNIINIRESLYSLSSFSKHPKIYDLGDVKQGKTENDLLIGLRDVIIELVTLNITPVIIGSAEIITYSNYLAYLKINKKINLVSIDSKIPISENKENKYKSALWKILIEENESLFSFTNIGYQVHFVSPEILKYLLDQQHFTYRLGYIRNNIKDAEPIFRDADMIGLNISAVKQSDAFGQINSSPNGYYAEEICQLAKYAGMSYKLSSFGIYDYISNNDINYQTANLIAQIIWYFIDGYNNRISEYPLENEGNYKKFMVNLDSFEYELVFYKSKKTQRWWIEVPSFESRTTKNFLISCTYDDYLKAGKGDVPERWLKYYQKIN